MTAKNIVALTVYLAGLLYCVSLSYVITGAANVVHCEAELIKAQELRKRCIERFNAERVRRGIPHE